MPIIETSAFTGLGVGNTSATVRDLKIIHTGGSAALALLGTAERVAAFSEATACTLSSAATPLLRDSVCRTTAGSDPALRVPAGFEVTRQLRNVTAISAGGPGIEAEADSASATLDAKNVIARGSTASGSSADVAATGTSGGEIEVVLDHSNYATVSEGAAATITPPGSGANQTADPLFVDLAGGDFHQLPDSPTVDAGEEDALVGPLDFEREDRVQGDAVDIGADEFMPEPPEEDGDGSPPPPVAVDSVAPKLWALRLSARRFAPARAPTARPAARRRGRRGARKRVRRSTIVSYRLSERARTVFLVQRGRPGVRRRVRGRARCGRPTRRLVRRGAKRCLRWRNVRPLLRRQGRRGLNRFRFTGQIGRRTLPPGHYRFLVWAIDAAGNRSEELRMRRFRVVRTR